MDERKEMLLEWYSWLLRSLHIKKKIIFLSFKTKRY